MAMTQLWTIIFVTLLAIGFGLAIWHDWEDQKRQRRKDSIYKERADEEVRAGKGH
jgi:hypothetical protein